MDGAFDDRTHPCLRGDHEHDYGISCVGSRLKTGPLRGRFFYLCDFLFLYQMEKYSKIYI